MEKLPWTRVTSPELLLANWRGNFWDDLNFSDIKNKLQWDLKELTAEVDDDRNHVVVASKFRPVTRCNEGLHATFLHYYPSSLNLGPYVTTAYPLGAVSIICLRP